MAHIDQIRRPAKGYFGVAMYAPKIESNVAAMCRSSLNFGAQFICIIGARYRRMLPDTPKAYQHIPLFHYADVRDFMSSRPKGCDVIMVEQTEAAVPLTQYEHPDRVIYLLGSEDNGFSPDWFEYKPRIRQICVPTDGCLNVATTGAIVLYDRCLKNEAAMA